VSQAAQLLPLSVRDNLMLGCTVDPSYEVRRRGMHLP
jgi:hypothetical protein